MYICFFIYVYIFYFFYKNYALLIHFLKSFHYFRLVSLLMLSETSLRTIFIVVLCSILKNIKYQVRREGIKADFH